MNLKFSLIAMSATILFSAGFLQAKETVDSAESAEREFTLKVLPLLTEKCLGCHGGEKDDIKGEYSVLSRNDLLRGGESEEIAIVPGKAEEGTLMEAITWSGMEMPPKENDRLTEEQVDLFRNWIRDGAPWPDEAKQARFREEERTKLKTKDGLIVMTSGGTSQQWTDRRYEPSDLWAWSKVKPTRKLLPTGVSPDHVIDFFVNRKMEDAELKAAAQASPRALIRRASFDLNGLPPTPEEIDAFKAAWEADADQAWSSLIDRLLESPRYGEHWGRHWLDVTRYADTGGMSNDYERSNMWRYRDYVMRSFNNDKPYNEFVVEQLAGDELADQSVRERKDGDRKVVEQTQIKGDYTEQEAEWIVRPVFCVWDRGTTRWSSRMKPGRCIWMIWST